MSDMDAIIVRAKEAEELFYEAFPENTEACRSLLEENPWALLSDPRLTADQAEAVLYWINSRAALDGVMDAAGEARDLAMRKAELAVARRTHKDAGAIIPATMKVDDRQVYIVKGEVVMHADGSGVDAHSSSESVVVMDAESGEYEFTSPDQIFKVGERIDPEDEKRTALEAIGRETDAIFGEAPLPPEGGETAEAEPEAGGNNDPENIPAESNNDAEKIFSPSVEHLKGPAPANVEEYDRGYEEGIQVASTISDETLNSIIEDLRSRDWLTDEWRGRLEAYEYIQQDRAQSVPKM